jgi:hypothetical protein
MVVRLSSYRAVGTAAVVLALAWPAAAQWDGDGHGAPVYQRRAFERSPHDDAHWGGQPPQHMAPPVAGGWFQRPYPYHLDYYRMRYGGSYAPYFGNLYGPPAIYAAPPYYGPYYGGYGGYGYGAGAYGYGPMDPQLPPPVEASPDATVPAP